MGNLESAGASRVGRRLPAGARAIGGTAIMLAAL
jgi:hypothetical protein